MRAATMLALGLLRTHGDPGWHLLFDGTNDKLTITADGATEDLPEQDLTVDFVAYWEDSDVGYIVAKTTDGNDGWGIDNILTDIYFKAVGASDSSSRAFTPTYDSTFRHYEFVWTASTSGIQIFVNGVEVTYSEDLIAAIGTYSTDAGIDLTIMGLPASAFTGGAMRWLRITGLALHTANFTPPSLFVAPAPTQDTMLLLALDEGTGTPVDTSGQENTVALAGATWVRT